MRRAFILLGFIAAATAAYSAEPSKARVRAAAMEALADATAHSGLCPSPIWNLNRERAMAIMLSIDIVDSEVEAMGARVDEIAEILRSLPADVVCRDAEERYGPEGEIVEGLLVSD